MRGGLQGVLSAQSQCDLHTTLCIHSSLPWSLLLLPCHPVLQRWKLEGQSAGSKPAPGPARLWDRERGAAAQEETLPGWCVGDALAPEG